ncbi:MAG: hypothetical protein EOP83_22175 [Verrucomicrobiaceae bacterium]|nr:MAG: hypothetical protein EOP83_22175 [Verrucomicrobiaceae bacterium]
MKERCWHRNEMWPSFASSHDVLIAFLRETFTNSVLFEKRPDEVRENEMTAWLIEHVGPDCLIDDGGERIISWSNGSWIVVYDKRGLEYLFEHAHDAINFKMRWYGAQADG